MLKENAKKFILGFLILAVITFAISASIMTIQAASGTLSMSSEGLGASYSGSGTWSGGGATASGTVSGKNGIISYLNSAQTATLTFTNGRDKAATLCFDYNITKNTGPVTIGGNTVTGSGNHTAQLGAGDKVQIVIKSGKGSSNTTAIDLSNISLVVDSSATTTFKAPENGTYTVDGTTITVDTPKTQKSTEAYALVATPATGYSFVGWYSTDFGGLISLSKTASFNTENDTTVYPVFIASTQAVFLVNNTQYYTDLGEANTAAQSAADKRITLIQSGAIAAGTYEISSGIQLLIPYDAAHTANFSNKTTQTQTDTNPTMYSCLTLSDGVTINCSGSINVNAQQLASSSRITGEVSGPYGAIQMNEGSQINMKSGSNLYAYGYIGGDGMVWAKSGSKVYQLFQILDWRGGNDASTLVGTLNNNSFILSQYYVQNVEAALRLDSEADMYVSFSIAAGLGSNKTPQQVSTQLMGSGGLFKITSGYITMKYDGSTDRMTLDVYGNIETANIKLSINMTGLIGTTIDTSQFIMPLPMNYTINVNAGSKVSFDQKFKVMPGTVINIEAGASATIGDNGALYLYDADDWNSGTYTYSGRIYQVGYVYARKDAPVSRSVNTDAVLKVDGTAIANGPVYSTKQVANGGGAKVTGNGTLILNEVADGSAKLKEVTGGGTTNTTTIACDPAVGRIAGYDGLNSFALGTYYGYDDGTSQYWYQFKTQMVLGSSLDLRIAIPEDIWKTGNKITISKPDGTAYTFTTGTPVAIPDSGNYYFFTFPGMAATEMAVPLTVSITSANGESIAAPFAESIQSYAMRMLNNQAYLDSTPTAQAMLVDMLNYGAAAQVYFDKETDDTKLANYGVTAAGTTANPFTDTAGIDGVGSSNTTAALQIGGNIDLLIKFSNYDGAAYAKVDFDSHWGSIGGQIYRTDISSDGVVTVDRLLIADARQIVTVSLYNESGEKIAEISDSIAAYLKRMSDTSEMQDLCLAALRFSDSAKAFLHARYENPTTGTFTPYGSVSGTTS